jgi:hypothetical protein
MGIFGSKTGEKGNIATVLFGAVAMVGIVSAATMQMISGPIKTASQVNNKNMVESQLQVGARLIVLNGGTTDEDADGTVEPVEHDGVNIGLTGGGGIPSSTGASLTDPWNNPYGYCVWDNGTDITIDVGENRLAGDDEGSTLAIALISSGPNRAFETDCFAYGVPPNEGVIKPSGSDDYIFKYTYAEASQAGGGLWSIGAVNPTDDVVVKDSVGTETIKVDKETGVGTFLGIVTPLIVGNGGAGDNELEIDAPGGVGIGTAADPTLALHVLKNQNAGTVLRFQNSTTGTAAAVALSLKSDQAGFFWMNLTNTGYTSPAHMANNGWIHTGSGIAGLTMSADGYFRVFTNGVGSTANERLRILANGNVGIGTSGPEELLHLSTAAVGMGRARFEETGTTGNNYPGLEIYNENAFKGGLFYSEVTDTVEIWHDSGRGINIDTNGNVGIGTTTPDNKLHLHNNVDGAAITLQFTNTDTGEASAFVGFRLGLCSTEDACLVNETAGKHMNFYTEGTQKMTIKNTGQIAIGTSNPYTTKMTIDGGNDDSGSRTTLRLEDDANPQIQFSDGVSTGGYITQSGANIITIGDYSDWTKGLTVSQATGFVGIGEMAPAASLEIQKNGGGLAMWFDQNTAADIYTRYRIPAVTWWTVGPKANGDFWFTRDANLGGTPNFTLKSNGDTVTLGNALIEGGYIYSGGKEAIRMNDTWLRLNNGSQFANGVYTPGNVRIDGRIYMGASRYLSMVTGSYGSVQINGAGAGTYQGYSIDGNVVFMSNGTNTGIYDDANNKWFMYSVTGSYTYLHYNGTWRIRTTSTGAEVNNTLAFASDRRLKENIEVVDHALDKLSQINGVSFNWKDKKSHSADTQLGVIAQDVQAVFPELVLQSDDEEGNDYLTVNYNGLVAPMIEAIKELKTENDTLKARLDKLEEHMKKVE